MQRLDRQPESGIGSQALLKISLCLLTKDELTGCRHDVPLIDRSGFDEIYAVDGNSRDGTVAYLEEQNIPVHQQPRRSLNAGVIYAFEKCSTDALVLYHPKGTISPAVLQEFRPRFEAGYELIVASRVIKGSRNEEDGQLLKPRKWFVLCLATATAVLFRREGQMVWDVLHGVRGMTCSAFSTFTPAETGATIDLEMVTEAYLQRRKRIEFAVHENPRRVGETHFKAIPTGWMLIKYLIRSAARRS